MPSTGDETPALVASIHTPSASRLSLLCCKEIRNTMMLRLRAKQVSHAFLYLLLGACFFLLVTLRKLDTCSSLPQPVDAVTLSANRSALVDTVDTHSSTFEKSFPYGTKRNDSNQVLFITSATPVQPEQFEWFVLGEYEFSDCPNLESFMRCHYISKPSAMNFSSAVLFHSRFLDETTFPTNRKSGQKWIFYESEPPPETWKRADLSKYRDYFNATSTYTLDSDVPLWYHKSICVPNLSYQPPTVNLAAKKSKMAVWFVSSCKTHSRREDYVRELQKYVDVDVFGRCGEARCDGQDGEQCLRDLINSTYKFYLSFENSLCHEYSTEKLSRVFGLDAIPIVLGMANYASVLPRGSYIDVRDFASPRDLAARMTQIDNDDALFNQYVIKKNSHWCHLPVTISYACQLCRYLHEHRYERKTIHDVGSFWSTHHRCMAPEVFYRGVADELLTEPVT